MQDLVLTSSFTVLGGVLIFVLGQIILKFIVEPLYEQSKLIGEITASLIYYIDLKAGGRFKMIDNKESTIVLRKQASDIIWRTYAIPVYWLWTILGRPAVVNVIRASKELILLSDNVDEIDAERVQRIARFLKIEILSRKFKE